MVYPALVQLIHNIHLTNFASINQKCPIRGLTKCIVVLMLHIEQNDDDDNNGSIQIGYISS